MAEPPGGALTFLLTDIEGSTALWERHPEAMHAALSRHDGILQALVSHHRGNAFKATGDGIFAAFGEPRAALAAALAIQHVVGTTSWGELGALRVRVVLHTGVARFRDGDYYGQTVNRVARLLSIAQGGQILLSEQTVALLDRELPEGVSLRSLGEVPLRGVADPLGVYLVEVQQAPDWQATRPAGTAAAFSEGSAPSPVDRAEAAPIDQAREGDLRVYTLGEFRVEQGDRTISSDGWGGSQARQLFKCLISRRTRRLPRDDAYELFFPDSADAAASTMRSTVYRLRRILEPDVEHANSLVVVNRDGIGLRRGAPVWVDAEAFERLVADARRADNPLPLLEQADQLYRGDYLPDDPIEEWAAPRREALRQLWIELQFDLARAWERQNNVDQSAAALHRLLAVDACDERAARELMLLLARHGRRADALRVFQRLAEALRADLDLDPSAETEEVRARIVAADGASGVVPPGSIGGRVAPAQPITSSDVTAARRSDRTEDLAALGPPPDVPVAPADPPFCPSYPFPSPDLLVGRQREILELRRLLERGRAGGRVALVGAPAGSGKSTIAGALVEYARTKGFLTLAGGSYDREGIVPFAPIRDALADYLLTWPAPSLRLELAATARDLSRVAPELGAQLGLPDEPHAEAIDAGRLFGAVHACLRQLASRQPVLLCLEDLHAADGATLALLHFLARQTRREPIVLLGTYRTDEVQPGQPLARTLATLAREGLSEQLILAPLEHDETADLVTALLDGPPSADLSSALYATSEGNPLFVEQLVLSLREDGRLHRRGGAWHHVDLGDTSLPPIIREVIERRFERLSPRCREVLEVASVIGQTFDHALLIESQRERDDELVTRDLDEAIRAQVVQERASGYAFGHAMLREALYRSMSGPLRGLLHARVGGAIERLAGERAAERAAELAHHFALAADVAPISTKALRYSLEAGRRAVSLSAHREALAHFRRACELVEREPADATGTTLDVDARIEALEGRAWVERQLGMWHACIVSCQTILELSANPVRRAPMRSIISRAFRSLGDTARAMNEVEDGLAELETADDSIDTARARVRLMYDRSYLLFLQGRFHAVAQLGRQMFGVAEPLGEFEREHLPCSTMLLAGMGLHNVKMATEYFRRGLALAERGDARLPQAVFRENAAITYLRSGQFADAAEQLRLALGLYGNTASDVRAVNAVQSLGRVLLAQGDVDGALSQADRALSHATEGHDRWAAECYDLLGAIETVRANWLDAVRYFDRALTIHEQAGDLADTADSLTGLGLVSELSGKWAEAESLYRRAMAIADRMDQSPEQVAPRRNLARILVRRGDLAAGVELLQRAIALAEAMRPTVEYGASLLVLAELQVRQQAWSDALETLDRALAAGGPAEFQFEAHAVAAEARAFADQPEAAWEHAATAERLAESLAAPRLLGRARLATARLAAHAGDRVRATAAYETAIRHLEEAQSPFDHAVAMREHGRLLLTTGFDPARGRALVEAARSRFEQLDAQPDLDACRPIT